MTYLQAIFTVEAEERPHFSMLELFFPIISWELQEKKSNLP